jgi:hypothetical protein
MCKLIAAENFRYKTNKRAENPRYIKRDLTSSHYTSLNVVQIKFQRKTHVTWKNLSTVIWTIVLLPGRKNFYDFQFHAAVQLKTTRFKYLLFLHASRAFVFHVGNDG